jgi:SAM-dependent methyltransferase
VDYDSCNLCGRTNSRPLVKGHRFGIEIDVVICSSCALVYQHPRMSEIELREFYEHDYRRIYSGSADTPQQEFLEAQEKRGADILGFCSDFLKPGSQVLDVGCGAGATLLPFRAAGHSVMGLEPGSYGTWGAESLGLDIRPAMLDTLAPGDVAPHLTIFSFVLEHVPRPVQTLADARRLASTGDYVFVEVPNLESLIFVLHRDAETMDDYFHVAHLTYFTPATLKAALRRSGWEVVKTLANAGRYSISALATATDPIPPEKITSHYQGNELSAAFTLIKHQKRREHVERLLRTVLRPGVRIGRRAAAQIVGHERADRVVRRFESKGRAVLNRLH